MLARQPRARCMTRLVSQFTEPVGCGTASIGMLADQVGIGDIQCRLPFAFPVKEFGQQTFTCLAQFVMLCFTNQLLQQPLATIMQAEMKKVPRQLQLYLAALA